MTADFLLGILVGGGCAAILFGLLGMVFGTLIGGRYADRDRPTFAYYGNAPTPGEFLNIAVSLEGNDDDGDDDLPVDDEPSFPEYLRN